MIENYLRRTGYNADERNRGFYHDYADEDEGARYFSTYTTKNKNDAEDRRPISHISYGRNRVKRDNDEYEAGDHSLILLTMPMPTGTAICTSLIPRATP